jgi:N-acetylmuramoyl-L-alanine amidase
MYFLRYLLILFAITGLFQDDLSAQKGTKINTVVIDAGHGGKDPGALGNNSKEKHIALAIALKTGEYIKKYLPDVDVIYTRKDDRFIPLHQRAEIANKNNADFFISIHCNSNANPRAYGSETYTMGLHKSEANLDVAILENAAILFEEDAEEQYGGFDANSVESYIQFNLYQNVYQDQSNLLATHIQDQFKNRVGRRDRGVHQAGFLVLWRTAMPGVLVELGFISNPSEEKFLMSEDGQAFMASAIYRAFKQYKLDFELENRNVEKKKEETEVTVESAITEEGLNYRVQFYTSPSMILLSDPRFANLSDKAIYEHNGLYKYTSGFFEKMPDALNHLSEVKAAGFKDAFVAAFKGRERISNEEARKLETNR